MKAHATPKGGQATGGQVLRLKRNDFVESILSREALSNPQLRTTLRLYREVVTAIDSLALHTAGNRERLSRFAVAMLAQTCVETALMLPHVDDPDLGIEHSLAYAVTICVERFSQAVKAKPDRFIEAARARPEWPVLWLIKDNAKGHKALEKQLQLGAGFPFKTKGALHLNAPPMKAVVDAWRFLSAMQCLVKAHPKLRILKKDTKQAVQHLGRIEFPPLIKDPASCDFWWQNGILPVLEMDKVEWLQSPALKKYRSQAEEQQERNLKNPKSKLVKDGPPKVWNLFTTDCRKALKRLAPG